MNENDKDIDLDNILEDKDKYLNLEPIKRGVKLAIGPVIKLVMTLNVIGLLLCWIDLFYFFHLQSFNVNDLSFLTGISVFSAINISPVLLAYVYFSKRKYLSTKKMKILFGLNIVSWILVFIDFAILSGYF